MLHVGVRISPLLLSFVTHCEVLPLKSLKTNVRECTH